MGSYQISPGLIFFGIKIVAYHEIIHTNRHKAPISFGWKKTMGFANGDKF